MSDIFALSDSAVDRLAAHDPLIATYQGVDGHNHRWPDLSPEGWSATGALYADLKAQAEACPEPDDRHALAKRVLIDYCEGELAAYRSGAHHVGLNNISSPHQTLRFVYGSQPSVTTADWEALIERVATVDQALAGYRATLEEGRQAGRTVSRRQVEAVIEQGEVAGGDQSSFHQLRSRLAAAASEVAESGQTLDVDSLGARLDAAVERAKQAYREFNLYLADTYLADAPSSDAAGEERYAQSVRRFLGTELDLPSTYRWGWDEVERLWAAMQQACSVIDADAPVASVLDDLRYDPRYAASSIEEFIELMQQRQEQALRQLEGAHFDVPDQIRSIDVQVEPAGERPRPTTCRRLRISAAPARCGIRSKGAATFRCFRRSRSPTTRGSPAITCRLGFRWRWAMRCPVFTAPSPGTRGRARAGRCTPNI
jgi:uncharacterized protein (DUF885 family)